MSCLSPERAGVAPLCFELLFSTHSCWRQRLRCNLCDYVVKVSSYFSKQCLKTKGCKAYHLFALPYCTYCTLIRGLSLVVLFEFGLWSLTLSVQISIVLYSRSASPMFSQSEPAGGAHSLYIRCQKPNGECLWLYSPNDQQTLLLYDQSEQT